MFQLILIFFHLAFATPAPGISLNKALQPFPGFVYGENGFTLHNGGTHWMAKVEKLENKKEILFSQTNTTGSLHVQSDILPEKQSFEDQLKKWIKDYPYYGFKILGTKTFKFQDRKGIMVDIVHRNKQKQVRQFLLEGPQNKYVVMTCENTIREFNNTLINCHKVLNTLKWL